MGRDSEGSGDSGSSSSGSRFEMETVQKSKDSTVDSRNGSSDG